ncbi:MAG: ABC transporter substrate-binding protein, partial [Deltaproteobacteria bacterium]|nr:ABC transporter substrate-binding protein [Deltaproteobacteria bacterium]
MQSSRLIALLSLLLLQLWGEGAHPQENSAASEDRQAKDAELRKTAIGIVLPISGKFKKLGDAALRAVEFALIETGGAEKFELLVKDSKGEASEAAKIASEFSKAGSLSCVIGAPGNSESLAVSDAAENDGIPFFSFARARSASGGKNSAYLRSGEAWEIGNFLSKVSGNFHGGGKMLVLMPENSYGKGGEQMITEAVRSSGWEIAEFSFYKEDLKGLAETLKKHAVEEEQPGGAGEKKIDAVFVSGTPLQIRKIKDFMEFYGLEPRQTIVGTGILFLADVIGDYSTLAGDAGNSFKGVIFYSAFPVGKQTSNQTLIRYKDKYGGVMTHFEMEIFEGAKLFFKCAM